MIQKTLGPGFKIYSKGIKKRIKKMEKKDKLYEILKRRLKCKK